MTTNRHQLLGSMIYLQPAEVALFTITGLSPKDRAAHLIIPI